MKNGELRMENEAGAPEPHVHSPFSILNSQFLRNLASLWRGDPELVVGVVPGESPDERISFETGAVEGEPRLGRAGVELQHHIGARRDLVGERSGDAG